MSQVGPHALVATPASGHSPGRIGKNVSKRVEPSLESQGSGGCAPRRSGAVWKPTSLQALASSPASEGNAKADIAAASLKDCSRCFAVPGDAPLMHPVEHPGRLGCLARHNASEARSAVRSSFNSGRSRWPPRRRAPGWQLLVASNACYRCPSIARFGRRQAVMQCCHCLDAGAAGSSSFGRSQP